MQRLFSNFANGWPGKGLLLQRILTAVVLFRSEILDLTAGTFSSWMIPQTIGSCAGIFLLFGLWTPVVGLLIAAIELWLAVTHSGDVWTSIVVGTLGVTVAMIGPGALSIDARLFGRKHIEA